MTTDDKIKNKKQQLDLIQETTKISTVSSVNLMNLNMLRVKRHYFYNRVESQIKPNLHTLLLVKLSKNKQQQLDNKEVKNSKLLKDMENKQLSLPIKRVFNTT